MMLCAGFGNSIPGKSQLGHTTRPIASWKHTTRIVIMTSECNYKDWSQFQARAGPDYVMTPSWLREHHHWWSFSHGVESLYEFLWFRLQRHGLLALQAICYLDLDSSIHTGWSPRPTSLFLSTWLEAIKCFYSPSWSLWKLASCSSSQICPVYIMSTASTAQGLVLFRSAS